MNEGSVWLPLTLRGSNRRAKRAWIEPGPPDPFVDAALRAIAEIDGKPYSPPSFPYLCWKPGPRVTLKDDFWQEVSSLCLAWIDSDNRSHKNMELAQFLVRFWEEFGPLWPEPECRLPISRIWEEVQAFAWVLVFYTTTRPDGRNVDLRLAALEEIFADSKRLGDDSVSSYTPRLIDGDVYLLPASKDDWLQMPVFPAFTSREEGNKWVRTNVILPSVGRLLRRSVRFVPVVSGNSITSLKIESDSAFALAVAQMVLRGDTAQCVCGCGRPVPPGRKYATPECRNKVKNREPYRKVLCYLNTLKRRGKIDPKTCEKGHRIAKKLRKRLDDYQRLKEEVLSQLGLW